MFPARVEKMVLDGNIKPHGYQTGTYGNVTADTKPAFDAYLEICFQAGNAYALNPLLMPNSAGDNTLNSTFFAVPEQSTFRAVTLPTWKFLRDVLIATKFFMAFIIDSLSLQCWGSLCGSRWGACAPYLSESPEHANAMGPIALNRTLKVVSTGSPRLDPGKISIGSCDDAFCRWFGLIFLQARTTHQSVTSLDSFSYALAAFIRHRHQGPQQCLSVDL